jgi:TRAP-type C4-dicarboxylate transport system permease small subunit
MPGVFRTLEKIKPVYDWAYKIMLLICKLLLIADIVITSITVAGRYFPFFTAPHWGEEIVLTLMVYMAVLSATLAIRKRSHIRMTAFDKYMPKKLLLTLDLLADIAVLALGAVLLIEGANVVSPTGNIAKFAKYSSLPNLSQIWMYMPVPVAGVGMIIFELEQVFQHIEEFFLDNKNTKEVQAK